MSTNPVGVQRLHIIRHTCLVLLQQIDFDQTPEDLELLKTELQKQTELLFQLVENGDKSSIHGSGRS